MIERWTRDDGWSATIYLNDDGSVRMVSHIPMINQPIPDPLTYEYMKLALEANGYSRMFKK